MYSSEIEHKCALCQKGEPIAGTLDVMCEKYGVVPYNYICKKYKYDIFKKKVKRHQGIDNDYNLEDFSID